MSNGPTMNRVPSMSNKPKVNGCPSMMGRMKQRKNGQLKLKLKQLLSSVFPNLSKR